MNWKAIYCLTMNGTRVYNMPGTISLILNGHETHKLNYIHKEQRREIIKKWRQQYDFDKIPGEVVIQPRVHVFEFLDDDMCKEIGKLYQSGEWTIKQLSERYTCSYKTISNVIKIGDYR